MPDTGQRVELFGLLRRVEADTVRMYDEALRRARDYGDVPLSDLRDGHQRHVGVLDELLGPCDMGLSSPPEEIGEALHAHLAEVRDAATPADAIARLLEAERTAAAEYAVAENARLSETEARAIHDLHEEQRRFVQALH